jgi:hypothetical protein
MKKILFSATLLIATILIAVPAFSQESQQQLSSFSTDAPMAANSKGIFMGGVPVSYAEAKSLLRPWPEAMKHLRAGRGWTIGSYAVSFAGGGMVGWGIGSALNPRVKSDRGTTIGLIAGGAAIIGGAYGLAHIGVGRFKKAAGVYNDAVSATTSYNPNAGASLALSATPGGYGLQLTF